MGNTPRRSSAIRARIIEPSWDSIPAQLLEEGNIGYLLNLQDYFSHPATFELTSGDSFLGMTAAEDGEVSGDPTEGTATVLFTATIGGVEFESPDVMFTVYDTVLFENAAGEPLYVDSAGIPLFTE